MLLFAYQAADRGQPGCQPKRTRNELPCLGRWFAGRGMLHSSLLVPLVIGAPGAVFRRALMNGALMDGAQVLESADPGHVSGPGSSAVSLFGGPSPRRSKGCVGRRSNRQFLESIQSSQDIIAADFLPLVEFVPQDRQLEGFEGLRQIFR